ncbi:MAG: hypothetical protein R3D00_06100 [Bacteroidia bacterium]
MVNTLLKPNAELPDYLFTKDYATFYPFGVEMINNERNTFFLSLCRFLKNAGEKEFSIKHLGSIDFYLSGLGKNHERIFVEEFDRKFSTDLSVQAILDGLVLPSAPKLMFLADFHKGIIHGTIGDWVIYFDRPLELLLVGIDKSLVNTFESFFLCEQVFNDYYYQPIEKYTTMSNRERFEQFKKNYHF